MHPKSEHLLDWFHVTMRLTGMSRLAQGVRAEDYPELSADLEEMLEHLKWNLWHGKVPRVLEIVDELVYALDVEDGSPAHSKLLKAARAFEGYLTNNRAFIPHYGERYRQGKIIATGFVEAAVAGRGLPPVTLTAARGGPPPWTRRSWLNSNKGTKSDMGVWPSPSAPGD